MALAGESKENRYSEYGKLVQSIRIRKLAEACGVETSGKHQAYSAKPLANGLTLICSGFPAMVTKVDRAGKLVWSLTAKDVTSVYFMSAGGAKCLENGNTLICNWIGHNVAGEYSSIFEVTPEKRMV